MYHPNYGYKYFNELYYDSSEKFLKTTRYLVGIGIMITIIYYLMNMFFIEENDWIPIFARILKKDCYKLYSTSDNLKNQIGVFNCIYDVEYTIDNKVFKNKLKINNSYDIYQVEDYIKIAYSKNNPDKITSILNPNEGYIRILIIACILVCLLTCVNTLYQNNYYIDYDNEMNVIHNLRNLNIKRAYYKL